MGIKDMQHVTGKSGQVERGPATEGLSESINRVLALGGEDHGCILAPEPSKDLKLSHFGLV